VNFDDVEKPVGAKPHLLWFFGRLLVLWIACFLYSRDGYYYVMSFVGAIALSLKWEHARPTRMPTWLKVALWIPAWGFLILLALIALRWIR